MDFRHRFLQEPLRVRRVGHRQSRVTGSPAAIAATQQSATHYYQRPDGALRFDRTRTSAERPRRAGAVRQGRRDRSRFETSLPARVAGLRDQRPRLPAPRRLAGAGAPGPRSTSTSRPRVFQRLFWNFNEWNDWTTAGLPLEHAVNTNVHTELQEPLVAARRRHRWASSARRTAIAARAAGRRVRVDPVHRPLGRHPGRRPAGGGRRSSGCNYFRSDEGRSTSLNVSPEIRSAGRPSRWTASLGLNSTRNADDTQWYGNVTDTGAASPTTPSPTWSSAP